MAIAAKEAQRPTHVEEAIQAMAAMHDAHHAEASALDRLIDRVAATISKSSSLIYVVLAIALWIGGNSVARELGARAADVWPFAFLSLLVSCTALFRLLHYTEPNQERDIWQRRRPVRER